MSICQLRTLFDMYIYRETWIELNPMILANVIWRINASTRKLYGLTYVKHAVGYHGNYRDVASFETANTRDRRVIPEKLYPRCLRQWQMISIRYCESDVTKYWMMLPCLYVEFVTENNRVYMWILDITIQTVSWLVYF